MASRARKKARAARGGLARGSVPDSFLRGPLRLHRDFVDGEGLGNMGLGEEKQEADAGAPVESKGARRLRNDFHVRPHEAVDGGFRFQPATNFKRQSEPVDDSFNDDRYSCSKFIKNAGFVNRESFGRPESLLCSGQIQLVEIRNLDLLLVMRQIT